jgi:hypothetical protein
MNEQNSGGTMPHVGPPEEVEERSQLSGVSVLSGAAEERSHLSGVSMLSEATTLVTPAKGSDETYHDAATEIQKSPNAECWDDDQLSQAIAATMEQSHLPDSDDELRAGEATGVKPTPEGAAALGADDNPMNGDEEPEVVQLGADDNPMEGDAEADEDDVLGDPNFTEDDLTDGDEDDDSLEDETVPEIATAAYEDEEDDSIPRNAYGLKITAEIPPPYDKEPHPFYGKPREGITGREWDIPDVFSDNTFIKYYKFRIRLYRVAESKRHLFQRMEEFLKKMFSVDKKFVIFTADEGTRDTNDLTMDIHNYEEILAEFSTTKLAQFFPEIAPKPFGGSRTMIILVGHDKTFNELKSKALGWWIDNDYGFFEKALQLPDTKVIGWAFLSHSCIDKEALAEEVSRWCGFPVGFNWWNIDGGKGDVRALHFEVDEKFAAADAHYLTGVYHAKKTEDYPHGVKLRFFPTLDKCNVAGKAKALEARKIQFSWDRGLIHVDWNDIKHLDHKSSTLEGKSVRDYMMSLFSQVRKDTHLFVGINQHWDPEKDVQIVTILPQVAEEAKSVLQGLLPHMRYHLNPNKPRAFDKLFESSAVDAAEGTVWDVASGGVVSYASQQMDLIDLEDEDLKYILEHADKTSTIYQLDKDARTLDGGESIGTVEMRKMKPPSTRGMFEAGSNNQATGVTQRTLFRHYTHGENSQDVRVQDNQAVAASGTTRPNGVGFSSAVNQLNYTPQPEEANAAPTKQGGNYQGPNAGSAARGRSDIGEGRTTAFGGTRAHYGADTANQPTRTSNWAGRPSTGTGHGRGGGFDPGENRYRNKSGRGR